MAARQVSDSFGMLVGRRAKMPSSLSKLDKRGCVMIYQGERRGGETRMGGEDQPRRTPLKPVYTFYYSS